VTRSASLFWQPTIVSKMIKAMMSRFIIGNDTFKSNVRHFLEVVAIPLSAKPCCAAV
jgi:hypothetical protein